MKRSYGVLAILLPLPNPKKPLILPHPLQVGDRLQTNMLQQLVQVAPSTLPLTTLKAKKLILNLFHLHGGTHIAVFSSLEQMQELPGGRIHPLLLLHQPPQRLDVFLGSDQSSIDVVVPMLTDEKCFQTLLAFSDKPHLLAIGPEGQLIAITEGYYVDKDNIRKASGLRRHRRISLV